ncbi:TetR/AcrR family transcriptional regulator [Allokutzneria sp. A3M-2-11 16]|uniref:TetR/AcrR family transcriptional regulator n=1 Tax=Allokutzneria sp. A3M-2-11 16 TaxID=2962043 RepID=UPI0020B7BD07|nr:TetR/AcrR family transcriptional regulator [Allokutzneria sp. A3M-2-11 16]MCP3803075.1 TetR/AcrR family transcriptional regulator [Allokutzneria sp. A3M-2-11 16]
MKVSRRTQADRTAATRAALIAAGRKLFAEHGFAGVGTETLVREAGVSRGALYHQFGDKTELFAEVLADIEGAVTQRLVAAMPSGADADLVAVMTSALVAWLDACENPEVQRIVLIDGPSVLGWTRWRAICQPHILGLIQAVLTQAAADGLLPPLPVKALSHVLLAIADEAALYVEAAQDRAAAREEIMQIVGVLMRALVVR